ncbi:PREDICTED: hemicentin-2-like [Amphimedon queenslandica]|uniref:Uncharacterized protein n=2 Tax=Amphimedon queenslandica TaxID=400682 RepID=A0AAN0II23_AMPQE|nr:PREDICTED: hemicentin-2-like [Amphimedon queenslandica]|eukprot:XP_003390255.2 PREDICTED: hemicentin-2-like [Amphimedon queenslandica]
MAIPGETGSTLSIRNIRTTDIGLYSCTVSNSRGSANSSSTAISVTSSVSINGSAPQSISNFAPSVPSGYTISPSNPRIRLTSSGELVTDELGPEDSGTYTFTSPDLGGATLSIGLNVLGPAHVISISGPQTVPSGSSVDISVVAGGSPDFTYQWFRNGMAIPGETGSTLSIRNINTTNIGLYSCTVSNSRGSANSSSTAISVTSSVSINGLSPQNISNFAPSVPSGYTISPSNPRIRLTSSGELMTDELGPEDTGTYNFTSPDLGGATLTISLNFFAPAYIISISGPQTVSSGSSVNISVVAGGTPTEINYQWFRNGMAIPGETGSTLSIRNVSTTDIGLYSCTPSNSRGSANSSSTTISVTSSVSINGLNPQNISNFAPSVPSGYTISPSNPRIRLTSSGELVTDELGPEDTGTYNFTSPDLGGATLTISVNFFAPAYIISISEPQTVSSGSSVNISVVAGGTPTEITYQWFRNGMAIPGEMGSTLSIRNVSTTDIGLYSCTPSNSRGSANSSSTAISVTSSVSINGLNPQNISNFAPSVPSGYTISPSNPRIRLTSSGELVTDELGPEDSGTYTFTSPDLGGATLTISLNFFAPAYIISISGPQTVSSGSSVNISVIAGGTPTEITYQWFRNGMAIPGETGSTLSIRNINTTDIGLYSCTPSNSRGSANSSSTVISVTSSLSINHSAPQSISNFAPSVPSGYTISPSNPRIRLTSSGELVTDELGPEDSGTYTFTSPDLGGATLSISVNVLGPAYIISISGPQTVSSGSSVDISVVAGGIPTDFTYQWFRNGKAIPGETGSTLSIRNINTTDIGLYSCTVSNSRGSANSSSTAISVTSFLSINGLNRQRISNFAPSVPSGYTISPSNPRIRLTSSGELVTDELRPEDSGTYTFSSPDLGGATLTISINVSIPTPPSSTIEGLLGRRIVIPCGNTVIATGYEWSKDGVKLVGENTSSLVLLNASYDHVGFYHCFASHSNGVASSKIELNIKGSRTLDWLTPIRLSLFPSVREAYNCSPLPSFIVTASGHLTTTGLTLRDSGNFSCRNKDINGTLKLQLTVRGFRPFTPRITVVRIHDRLNQYFYVEWTQQITPKRPVRNYTLYWRVTNSNRGTTDKRQLGPDDIHSVVTTNNSYFLSYEPNEIFNLTVSASNVVGDSPLSEEHIFIVNDHISEPVSGAEPFPLWIILLIVFISLLICCICCICCFICFCCLCARKKRDYDPEEHERKYSTELAAYRKKGEDEDEGSSSDDDDSAASIKEDNIDDDNASSPV